MFEPCEDEQCSACFRVDSDNLEESGGIETYVGHYVVITEEGSAPLYVQAVLKALTGVGGAYRPSYITMVGYVGPYSLAESTEYIDERLFHRFIVRHDSPSNAREAHAMVVEGIRTLLIDVSRPLTDDEFDEQMMH